MNNIEFVESEFVTRNGVRVRQDTGELAPEELSESEHAFRAWKQGQAMIKRQEQERRGK